MGTSAPIIGRYERNEIKPAIDTAKSIADVLGVTGDFLIGGEVVVMDKELLQKNKGYRELWRRGKSKGLRAYRYGDFLPQNQKGIYVLK